MKTKSFSIVLNVVLAIALTAVSYLYGCAAQENEMAKINRQTVADVDRFIERNQPALDSATRRGYAEFMVEASDEYRLPPKLLAAVGFVESGFSHSAVGDGGKSTGLFQLNDFWIGKIPFIHSKQDLYRPDLNIRAGAFVLSYMNDRCGDDSVESMLATYNAGEKNKEYGRRYALRVLSFL